MKSQEKCNPKVTYAVVLHGPERHKVDVINLVFAQLALWFRTFGTFFFNQNQVLPLSCLVPFCSLTTAFRHCPLEGKEGGGGGVNRGHVS